jgi:hypothetical protein
MRIVGVLLIVLGLVGLVYGGIQWTRQEEVVDLGPVEVTRKETRSVPIPPIAGGICLVAGVVVLGMSRRHA